MIRPARIINIALALILTLTTALMQYPREAYAAENSITLDEKVSYAVNLLSQIMQSQYDNTVDKIKQEISAGGHDYTYSMESFLDLGNPYKDMDYIELLATYAAVKNELRSEGRPDDLNLKTVPFITYTSEEVSFGDVVPYKIEEYELVNSEKGLYEKTGYRYSDVEEQIEVYEELEDGVYIKTGTTTVRPEQEDRTYLEITLNVISPSDLYQIAGVEKTTELEKDVLRRRGVLEAAADNDTLKANIFVKLPDGLIGMDNWARKFLEAVGYRSDDIPVRIDGETIARIASTLEGQVPYEWGGKSKRPGYDPTWWTYDMDTGLQNGLDCSGFVQWCYRTAGFPEELLGTLLSTSIMDSNYQGISRSELKPGDIGLNMSRKIGHCGIYAGDGMWWHCSSSAGTVTLQEGTGLGFSKIIRPVNTEEEYVYRKIRVYDPVSEENTLRETDESLTNSTDDEDRQPEKKEEKKQQEQENNKGKNKNEKDNSLSENKGIISEDSKKEEIQQEPDAKPEPPTKQAEEKQDPEQEPAKEEALKEQKEEATEPAKQEKEDKTPVKPPETEIKQESEKEPVTEAPKKEEPKAAPESTAKDSATATQKPLIELPPLPNAGQDLMIAKPAETVTTASEADVLLLAQLISHEARNQGLNGWVAVGEVVLNRVNSPLFPNDYRSVIYQSGQFTGSSALKGIKPDAQLLSVARGVMSGQMKVLGSSGVLYFRNAGGKTGNWGRHQVYTKIGDHTFYLQ